MKTKQIAGMMILLAGFFGCCPVWAGSKTATIRVSCTILPMIEMSSPRVMQVAAQQAVTPLAQIQRPLLGVSANGSVVNANSNLNGNHRLTEGIRKGTEGLVRVYSVTAA